MLTLVCTTCACAAPPSGVILDLSQNGNCVEATWKEEAKTSTYLQGRLTVTNNLNLYAKINVPKSLPGVEEWSADADSSWALWGVIGPGSSAVYHVKYYRGLGESRFWLDYTGLTSSTPLALNVVDIACKVSSIAFTLPADSDIAGFVEAAKGIMEFGDACKALSDGNAYEVAKSWVKLAMNDDAWDRLQNLLASKKIMSASAVTTMRNALKVYSAVTNTWKIACIVYDSFKVGYYSSGWSVILRPQTTGSPLDYVIARISPSANSSTQAPATISFSANSSVASSGTITSYHWDFYDGTVADGANVTHTFTEEDCYYVNLTVTTSQGRTGTSTVAIAVGDQTTGPVRVSGTITGNTHWTADRQVYVVDGSITVASGATLTIDPGVVVKFASVYNNQYSYIDCKGRIVAQGTASAPIYFTSIKDDSVGGDTDNAAATPAKGDWSEILIDGSGASGVFDHCVVKYGGFYYWLNWVCLAPGANLACTGGGTMSVNDSTISQSKGYGVYWDTAGQSIRGCILAYNNSYGLYLNCTGSKVSYCDSWSNGSADYYGTSPILTGNISLDPLFVNASAADYRLQDVSPCIDAGDPKQIDADGSRSDIGAFPNLGQSIASGKSKGNDQDIASLGGVVSAIFTDSYYVESYNRIGGIRVEQSGHSMTLGQNARVTGTIKTNDDGERYILPTLAFGTGNSSITPLFLANRNIGGVDWNCDSSGKGQKGVANGSGLNNIGMLIKAIGKFTYIDSRTFTIDDGSDVNVKCVVPSGVTLDPNWNHVSVTGISSCERVGDDVTRLLRIRMQSDITHY